jgi:hypothetical protein
MQPNTKKNCRRRGPNCDCVINLFSSSSYNSHAQWGRKPVTRRLGSIVRVTKKIKWGTQTEKITVKNSSIKRCINRGAPMWIGYVFGYNLRREFFSFLWPWRNISLTAIEMEIYSSNNQIKSTLTLLFFSFSALFVDEIE